MENYNEIFKKIYYHLYSNSNSSRAETIISDLSKLLLCKLADEKNYTDSFIDKFLNDEDTLENTLIKALKVNYPTLPAYREGFSLDEISLKQALREIKKINLLSAPSQVIGDAFQALIGPNIRGDKGQFFTPRNVVKSIVNIVKPKSNEVIMDPACGPGGFLSEAYNYINQHEGKEKFTGKLIGIDKDKDLSYLATALLSILTPGNSTIYNENSLEFYAEKIKANEDIGEIDVIIANPPFGSKIGIKSKEILEQFDFGYNWELDKVSGIWSKTSQLLTSQDPQMLFLELSIRLLKKGGRMGIVLPEGMFGNSRQAYIWQYVRSKGKIVALVDCPRTTFQPSTDTKTNILVFEKTENSNDNLVNVAIAVNCGHDKRGRTVSPSGAAYPDDFVPLSEQYETDSDVWKKCGIKDNYVVPRYHFNKVKQNDLLKNINSISFKEMLDKGYLEMKKGNEVGSEAYGTGNIPFVRTSDIINLEISKDPTNSVSEEIYMQFKDTQNLKEGDILFVFDGRYRIGNTAIITKYNQQCVVQSHIKILKLTKEAPFTPYEFFYLLNLPEVKEQIRNLIFIQSTLGTIGPRIEEIRLPVFNNSIEWQSKILDFKETIEKRAELLEKIQTFNKELTL